MSTDTAADEARLVRRVRVCLVLFVVGLVLSGLTAFAVETELRMLGVPVGPAAGSEASLRTWLRTVHTALAETNHRYPFLAYGTDWLAFAHLAIAVAFLGPIRDPVRNKWVITFGLIACAGVVPLAMIAGPVRGIPLAWRLVDCSFGVLGAVPLLICRHAIVAIEFLRATGGPCPVSARQGPADGVPRRAGRPCES